MMKRIGNCLAELWSRLVGDGGCGVDMSGRALLFLLWLKLLPLLPISSHESALATVT